MLGYFFEKVQAYLGNLPIATIGHLDIN